MRNTFAIIMAALALSACGKSLHISEKPESKLQIKRTLLGDPIAQKVAYLSKYDLEEVKKGDLILPFGTEGTQFRALHYLPEAKGVESVSSLRLNLKGLKIAGVAADEKSDLSKVTLCLLEKDSRICAGSEVPDGFTASSAGKALRIVADAGVKGSYSIDLLEAFDLKDKSAEAVLAFLEKNSTDYDGKGYRKFRLSVGKRIEFEEGSLEIQTELKKGTEPVAIEVPGAPLNAGDDAAAEPAQEKAQSTDPAPTLPATTQTAAANTNTPAVTPASSDPAPADPTSENPAGLSNEPVVTTDESPEAPLDVIVEKVVDSNMMLFSGKKTGASYQQVLKAAPLAKLDQMTNLIASQSDAIEKVYIQCTTDLDGALDRNTEISQERADYVKANLVAKAPLLSDKITAVGLGPVESSSCGAKKTCLRDRRIVITLTMRDASKTAELQQKLDGIR